MKALKLNKKIAFLTASAVALAGLGAIKAYAATSVIYRVYDYSTGTANVTYTLTQNERTQTAAYSLATLDNRIEYNNSGVVRLSTGGTGFVIGDHTIATAADNVYHYEEYEPTGEYVTGTMITLYDNSGNVSMTVAADEAHFPTEYISAASSIARRGYNYAFINVSEDLSEYEHFDLGIVMEELENNTIVPVRVAGVDEKDGVTCPYTSLGRFGQINDPVMYCNSYTTAPQVGGPLYLTTAYSNGGAAYTTVKTVVGILIDETKDYRDSMSLRINSRMFQFYYNNDYNTYE